MKKIKLTEAQYKACQELIAEQEMLDTVDKTKGGHDVRNLIKEGDTIKGEYKTVYGKWNLTEWDSNGAPLISENKYNEIIFSLDLKESFAPELTETANDEIYFDTFSGAVQTARTNAEAKGFTVDEQDWDRDITFGRGKPSVGQTTRASIGLSLNGKPQRKALHIQVYGMDSGKYELNTYIN